MLKCVPEITTIEALIRNGATPEQAVCAVNAYYIGTRDKVADLEIEINCMRGILEARDCARAAAEAHDTATRLKASDMELKWTRELMKHRNEKKAQPRKVRRK